MTDYAPTPGQCCGKCRWFAKLSGHYSFGDCLTPATKDKARPPITIGHIMHRNEGTTCPCFKPRMET